MILLQHISDDRHTPVLTTPAIAGIALFWALKVRSNTIIFLQMYVRFVPDPMGSDAKNTLTLQKLGQNVI